MPLFDDLHQQTGAERAFLLDAPAIRDALRGEVSRERYLAFLTQAWHHVRHTFPLLMALGSRLPDRLLALQPAVLHYLEEEQGHDQWILNDIVAAGGDAEAVRHSAPNPETDALVGYCYDQVMRRNPVGLFGMVFVLEGTSAAIAVQASRRIQAALDLPDAAFSYLRSHGELDQLHVRDLAGILDRLEDPADQAAVLQSTRTVFWLYGAMFRGLDRAAPALAAARRRSAA